jgi:hypothetical protein
MSAYHSAVISSTSGRSARQGRMTRLSGIVVAALLGLAVLQGTAAAQQRFTLFGMVQWTSSNRVQVMTDGGASVSVDVSRLDQGSYTSLRSGDRVRIIGYVAPDRARVIAEELEVGDASSGFWTFPQTG